MKYIKGKTEAQITSDVHQSLLKEFDIGYIDGYVQAADTRPYAVFVRYSDGIADLVPLYQLKAIIHENREP